jgi:hypothetical protein
MIGWIAPRVSSELIPSSGPPFDADVLAETARIHERAGFDRVLIGYFSDAPDGFLVGAHAASVTERLSFLLVTHRLRRPAMDETGAELIVSGTAPSAQRSGFAWCEKPVC